MATDETITAIKGIRVGHAEDRSARTGCTVLLCEAGAIAGVDVRGAAPGTRETDVLRPENLVERVHAVLLTGGSAFGLDAAGGVMAYLEERGIGFPVGDLRVPIVPAAVLFDLGVGDPYVRPDREMGRRACECASEGPVPLGAVGAGVGATVGKLPGCRASDGGIGSALLRFGNGGLVGALVAVNALGNIVDPRTGRVIAGATDPKTGATVDFLDARHIGGTSGENTTIGVVATNVVLTPAEAMRVAQMAHDGIARTIRPAHTMFDGDTLFALSIGEARGDVNTVGVLAAEAVAEAIVRAVAH